MKRLLLFIFLMIFGLVSAQEKDRIPVNGTISVPMGDDPEGVAIVNITTGQGTFSREGGDFRLEVAVEDTVRFTALQYQEFSVIIDQGVIDTGQLIVTISESITELPEVVVSPLDLSGNVEVDVMRIPTETTNLPDSSAAEIEDTDWDFRPDDQTSPQNAAMRNTMIFSGNARNFGNIFRHIFTSRSRSAVSNTGSAPERRLSNIDDEIQNLYNDGFFIKNLDIKKENIHEFIFFAEDNGLTSEMLKEENEIELIRFLLEQSERYKNQ
ncbi:hypothetical protein [Salinimicrobium marinum]|nr:hypothetical protein [Salinimicrobium marinum]